MMLQASITEVFMIHRKSKIGIQIELGSRHHLFQHNGDYRDPGKKTLRGSQADIQAEILVAAVNIFNRNSRLSAKEVNIIEDLDKVLDKVDVILAPGTKENEGPKALNFIVETGENFIMNRSGDLSRHVREEPKDESGQEKILEKAFLQFTNDHRLTKKEIEMIEKIDDVLPNADIIVNPMTGDAIIACPEGTLNIAFPKDIEKRHK